MHVDKRTNVHLLNKPLTAHRAGMRVMSVRQHGAPEMDLYETLVTYEGPVHMSNEERILSTIVLNDLQDACRSIEAHLKMNDIELT